MRLYIIKIEYIRYFLQNNCSSKVNQSMNLSSFIKTRIYVRKNKKVMKTNLNIVK